MTTDGDPAAPLPSSPEGLPPEALEGIQIDILDDGTVRLHTSCRPGDDPARCRERLQFLVDALGIPVEGVVTEVTEELQGTDGSRED